MDAMNMFSFMDREVMNLKVFTEILAGGKIYDEYIGCKNYNEK